MSEFLYFAKNLLVDVICVQETHLGHAEVSALERQWPYKIFVSAGTNRSRGVLIMYRKGLQVQVLDSKIDPNGRFVVNKIVIQSNEFLLVNIYAPNADCVDFFADIFKIIEAVDVASIMILGDFNLVLDPSIDRTENRQYSPNAVDYLLKQIEQYKLFDVWRLRNPGVRAYSWCRNKPRFTGSRIDFVLTTQGLCNIIKAIEYQTAPGTDHKAIMTTLQMSFGTRGPGIWKLNCTLLKNARYLTTISEFLSKKIIEYANLQPQNKWELLKYEVANKSREFSAEQSRIKRATQNNLCTQIDLIQSAIQIDPSNKSLANKEEELRASYDMFIHDCAMQARFRSRARWMREGEKSSKYFFSLEKERYNSKLMSQLLINGRLINDPDEILRAQSDFYRTLYTEDSSVSFNLVNQSQVVVTQADKLELDGDVSLAEFSNALRKLKIDRTPGLDGLPPEFYVAFWDQLGPLYLDMIHQSITDKKLCLSARRGVISLIPKKGRDMQLLKNWRPITLLNADYKILAKTLALRLKKVINYIISNDQTGFLEGRQISTTIRRTMDSITYCEKNGIQAYLISLDYEKCFDKISYSAIRGSLKYFGIGDKFVSLVDLLLSDFWSCTTNNGFCSNYFRVERSTHQGDPIASYLFLLTGEVLALTLKANQSIQGIDIYAIHQILLQFADDTQLYALNNEVVCEYVQVLREVQSNTGLTVNYEKSSIHPLGGAIRIDTQLKWDPLPPVILGINTGSTGEVAFDQILDKIESVAKNWYYREFTLLGKILLVNTLMGSLFMYKMFVHTNPEVDQLKRFDEIIGDFIWKGKRSKIKQSVLKAHRHFGGMRLIDALSKIKALKISWLFNMDPFYVQWREQICPPSLGTLLWRCNLNPKQVNIYFPMVEKFWHQVLEAWFELTYKECVTEPGDILSQILWYNSHVTSGNRVFEDNELIECGVIYVEDLLDNSHNLLSHADFCHKYSTVDWFWYVKLTSSVPKHWLQKVKGNPLVESEYESLYDKIAKKTKIISYVYNLFINQFQDGVMNVDKLILKARLVVSSETYIRAYMYIYQVTNVTKLRDFQYRLMQGAIHCNNKLYYWRISDSKTCEICNNGEVQDIKHLLFECKKSEKLWWHLRQLCQEITPECKWTYENIFLNAVHPRPHHVINFLVLVTKQYVYACKCTKSTPHIKVLLLKILEYQRLEKFNARTTSQVKH